MAKEIIKNLRHVNQPVEADKASRKLQIAFLDQHDFVQVDDEGNQKLVSIKLSDTFKKYKTEDFRLKSLLAAGVPLKDVSVVPTGELAERLVEERISEFENNPNVVKPSNN